MSGDDERPVPPELTQEGADTVLAFMRDHPFDKEGPTFAYEDVEMLVRRNVAAALDAEREKSRLLVASLLEDARKARDALTERTKLDRQSLRVVVADDLRLAIEVEGEEEYSVQIPPGGSLRWAFPEDGKEPLLVNGIRFRGSLELLDVLGKPPGTP